MVRFSLAVRTSNITNDNAAVELIAGPIGCRVFKIRTSLVTAAAWVLGIGRPAAQGVTPATLSKFTSTDGEGVLSQSQLALTWGTSPTAPTQYISRDAFPATVGSFREWSWANGIWIPATKSLTIHNILGGPTSDTVFEILE